MRSARSEADLKRQMLDLRNPIPIKYPSQTQNKLLIIAELCLDSGTFDVPIYSNTNLKIVAKKFAKDHNLDSEKEAVIVKVLQNELKASLLSNF